MESKISATYRCEENQHKSIAMNYLKAAVATAITFLVVDLAWISLFLGDVYRAQLGAVMLEEPRAWPAAVFYVGYIAGIVFFAVRPALSGEGTKTALLNGALLGALAYGTYTLTNHAIFAQWSTMLVVSDIAWGAFLTAVSAAAGYLVARR